MFVYFFIYSHISLIRKIYLNVSFIGKLLKKGNTKAKYLLYTIYNYIFLVDFDFLGETIK